MIKPLYGKEAQKAFIESQNDKIERAIEALIGGKMLVDKCTKGHNEWKSVIRFNNNSQLEVEDTCRDTFLDYKEILRKTTNTKRILKSMFNIAFIDNLEIEDDPTRQEDEIELSEDDKQKWYEYIMEMEKRVLDGQEPLTMEEYEETKTKTETEIDINEEEIETEEDKLSGAGKEELDEIAEKQPESKFKEFIGKIKSFLRPKNKEPKETGDEAR